MPIFKCVPDDLISVSSLLSLDSWMVIDRVPDCSGRRGDRSGREREKTRGESPGVVNASQREEAREGVSRGDAVDIVPVVILTIDEMRKRAQGGK
jgi:hypothetical protein